MRVRWESLLKAAITVGRESTYLSRPWSFSVAEMVSRASCIMANFETVNNRLVPTAAFKHLDPTEKAHASYYLGMALTSVWAEEVVRVPWLTHISKMRLVHNVALVGSREPDLLGPRVNSLASRAAAGPDWLVAEAKGRIRLDRALLDGVRAQKSAVTAIDGRPPWLAVGCISHHEGAGVRLRVVDPEPDDDGLRWEIGAARFLAAYYAPVVDLFDQFPRGTDQDGYVQIAHLPGTGVQIAADDELLDRAAELRQLLRLGSAASSAEQWTEHVNWFTSAALDGYEARNSPDGLVVELDVFE